MENTSMSPEVIKCSPEKPSSLCPSFITRQVLPVFCGIMVFMGIPGNILSLWVFAKKIPSKTPTHIYLINLSVSNLMLCATMPMLAAYYAAGEDWCSHQLPCQVTIGGVTPVLHINISVAMLILTWVALSRLATLTERSHNGRPSTCTRILPSSFFRRLKKVQFARVICLGIWVFLLGSIVPAVAMYTAVESRVMKNASDEACYSVAVEVGGKFSQIISLGSVMLFTLCFLLVLASYISVSRHIRRARRNTAVSDRHQVYSRVFRNIVVIQLVLAVCLLPHHVFKAFFIALVHQWRSPQLVNESECHHLFRFVEVKNVLLLLAAFRSVADPITYFLLDNTFRKYVVDLMGPSTSHQSSQMTESKGDTERTNSKATKV